MRNTRCRLCFILQKNCNSIYRCNTNATTVIFATMYDNDLRKHVAIHERRISCAICNKQVLNMQNHLNSAHKQCVACLNYFIDRQQLMVHEPKCKIVQANTISDNIKEKTNKENSLEIDSKNIESSFSNLLISMLESSGLPQAEVMQGKRVISSFAAESKIAKNRVRLENVSLRRNDALFFDVPDFQHSSKSNLPKVLAAVGTVQEHEKFDATSEQAKRNAINNFEKLDVILTKMEKLVLLGSLNERQSTSVLEMYYTQRIIDEISSYLNSDFKELSYSSIVETAQFLYVPLNLEIFQHTVLAYRKLSSETFLEFSSRVFRHLKLCSRLFPAEKRENCHSPTTTTTPTTKQP